MKYIAHEGTTAYRCATAEVAKTPDACQFWTDGGVLMRVLKRSAVQTALKDGAWRYFTVLEVTEVQEDEVL